MRFRVPYYKIPLHDANGELNLEVPLAQDFMGWVTQTPVADRTRERLGEPDVGIIQLRRMLNEAMAIVADGGDPMSVFRDPAANTRIALTQERVYYTPDRNQARMIRFGHQRYNPAIDEIIGMFPE